MVEIAPLKQQAQIVRPVPFRGGGFAPRPVRHVALILFIALIALAEVGTRVGFISNLTLPALPPSSKHLSSSGRRVCYGSICCHRCAASLWAPALALQPASALV